MCRQKKVSVIILALGFSLSSAQETKTTTTTTTTVTSTTSPGPTKDTKLTNAAFIAGVDVNAGASMNPDSNFTAEVSFDRALSSAIKPNQCKAEATKNNPECDRLQLDAPVWVSGYVRFASVAQPGQISSTTTLTSYLTPAIASSPENLVKSGEMQLAFDAWPGHLGDNDSPVKIMFTATAGAITPLSSAPTNPTIYTVSQSLFSYYVATSTDPTAKSAVTAACGTSFSTTTPCYIAFIPKDRTSFFRNWGAGVKIKNYYFNRDGATEKSNYYPYPGITTITAGQNEYVTGGSMKGYVLHIGTLQPLPAGVAQKLAGYLYVFGSMDMVIRRNILDGNAPQFSLATAASTITANSPNVAEVNVAQPNRDRYRFGMSLDIGMLLSKLGKQ